MLQPHEFAVGTLADAKPGTLLLPRTKFEFPFIVGSFNGETYGVALTGEFAFMAIQASTGDRWGGVLIPDVTILIDHTAIIDHDITFGALGAIVRQSTELAIQSRPNGHPFLGRTFPIVLTADLSSCAQHQRAEFARWQIMLGKGADQRALFEVDCRASKPNS